MVVFGGAIIAWCRSPETHLAQSQLTWLDGTRKAQPPSTERCLQRQETLEAVLEAAELDGEQVSPEDEQLVLGALSYTDMLSDQTPEGRPSDLAKATNRACAEDFHPRTLESQTGTARRKPRVQRATAFTRHWVAAVRLHFPMRADRPSDIAAMSKWLSGELRAMGVRPVHAETFVPVVVHLALLPSPGEIYGRAAMERLRPRTRGGRLLWDLKQRVRGIFSAADGVGVGEYNF